MDKELCYANNPYSLFRKYKELITILARKHTIFREFVAGDSSLAVPKDVALLLPNGFIEFDCKQARLTVTTGPIYSPQLSPILRQLDNLISVGKVEHFGQAEEIVVYLTGETNKIPRFAPYREMPRVFAEVMFASSTFNPDADPESTSVDGDVTNNDVDVSWATIRGAATGTAADDNTGSINCQVQIYLYGTPSWQNMRRFFTLFDTSSLPDDLVSKDSATWSLYVSSKNEDFDDGISMATTSPASNTALVTGDYDQVGGVKQASDINITSISTAAYNDYSLNATGLGNISLTGITKFGGRTQSDMDNVEPTGTGNNQYAEISFHSAEGANAPKLAVTYTPAAAGGTRMALTGVGI